MCPFSFDKKILTGEDNRYSFFSFNFPTAQRLFFDQHLSSEMACSIAQGWHLDLSVDPVQSYLHGAYLGVGDFRGPDKKEWHCCCEGDDTPGWDLESFRVYCEKIRECLAPVMTQTPAVKLLRMPAGPGSPNCSKEDQNYDPTDDDAENVWRFRWSDPQLGFVQYCGRDRRRVWPQFKFQGHDYNDQHDGREFDFTVIDCPAGCLVVGNDGSHPFVTVPNLNWGYSHGDFGSHKKPRKDQLILSEVVHKACDFAYFLMKRHAWKG